MLCLLLSESYLDIRALVSCRSTCKLFYALLDLERLKARYLARYLGIEKSMARELYELERAISGAVRGLLPG